MMPPSASEAFQPHGGYFHRAHVWSWPLAEGQLSACHVGCQGQTGRRSNLASTAAFGPIPDDAPMARKLVFRLELIIGGTVECDHAATR